RVGSCHTVGGICRRGGQDRKQAECEHHRHTQAESPTRSPHLRDPSNSYFCAAEPHENLDLSWFPGMPQVPSTLPTPTVMNMAIRCVDARVDEKGYITDEKFQPRLGAVFDSCPALQEVIITVSEDSFPALQHQRRWAGPHSSCTRARSSAD